MVAALTPVVVLGVPIESRALKGLDSLLSIVQMPGGVPVGTLAIGKPGAINAALLAAGILALGDTAVAQALDASRLAQTQGVDQGPDPGQQAHPSFSRPGPRAALSPVATPARCL